MLRTFDFIYQIKYKKDLKKEVKAVLASGEDYEMDIGGWHLSFDSNRKYLTVTDNGTDDYLTFKFVPGEISYDSLERLIEPKKEKSGKELEYKFFYDT